MVIAYLRVSTSKQHLVNQQDEIRRFAHTKEIEVSRWVTEIVSGFSRKTGRIRKKESKRTEVRESNQSIKTGRHAHRYRNIEIKPHSHRDYDHYGKMS